MKKYFSLLLITLSMFFQSLNGQSNPALIYNLNVTEDNPSGFRISWTIANNEVAKIFELEKSFNGKDFTTIAALLPTQKKGAENYIYRDTINSTRPVMFRLNILNSGHDLYYTNVLLFHAKQIQADHVRIIGNPVRDNLTFSFYTGSMEQVDVIIYNILGKIMLHQKVNSTGSNTITTINLNNSFTAGMYVMQINNSTEINTVSFIKQ